MSVDFNEFSKLVQAANLVEISLKSSSVDCKAPPRSIVANKTKLDYERSTEFILSEDKSLLVCFCTLTLKGLTKEDEDENIVFEIDATFSLIYSLSELNFADETYGLFAEKNAFYNAYPYFRELFQNFSTRMGIDPVKLPLLKPSTKEEMKKELGSKEVKQ